MSTIPHKRTHTHTDTHLLTYSPARGAEVRGECGRTAHLSRRGGESTCAKFNISNYHAIVQNTHTHTHCGRRCSYGIGVVRLLVSRSAFPPAPPAGLAGWLDTLIIIILTYFVHSVPSTSTGRECIGVYARNCSIYLSNKRRRRARELNSIYVRSMHICAGAGAVQCRAEHASYTWF